VLHVHCQQLDQGVLVHRSLRACMVCSKSLCCAFVRFSFFPDTVCSHAYPMCLSVFKSLYYLLLFICLSVFLVPIPPLPPPNSHRPWSAAADGVKESEATQPREKRKRTRGKRKRARESSRRSVTSSALLVRLTGPEAVCLLRVSLSCVPRRALCAKCYLFFICLFFRCFYPVCQGARCVPRCIFFTLKSSELDP
jgi:hypothetical protein